MNLGLAGKTAIVCGASSGMGLGIAEALRSEDVNVVALARRAELLAREATRIGADYLACDLTEPEAPKLVVDETVERHRGIDIVVWNSGGPPPSAAAEITADALTGAFESLELPLVRLLEAALPHLRRSDAGRILAITATGVKEPTPNIALSNALRPGIVGYLKTLSREVAGVGITRHADGFAVKVDLSAPCDIPSSVSGVPVHTEMVGHVRKQRGSSPRT